MVRWTPWSLRIWPAAAEGATARAAAEWRQTFDAIDAPIVVLDVEGRVVRLNVAGQRLLGLEFRDILGRTAESLAPWEPWRAISEIAREAASGEAAAPRKARGERGKEWQISASVLRGASRQEERVIVLARDVTEIVRLDASLRRAEVFAQLGGLVSGVAHEVRNPLFAISAAVDALEARTAGREELRPLSDSLRSEVARLGRLMGDLLDYGRPPALALVEADLGEVVAGALRTVAPLAEERRVTVRNLVVPGLARLRLDPARIAQVVQNLAENAVRLSPPGAEVEVSGAAEAGDVRRVHVAVADRGPGFARADLDRVFEPFFTRRPGGTGLGLAIVRRLVDDHGGVVEAHNRAGGGAVVRFWLPVADPGVPPQAGGGPAAPPGG